MIRRRGNKFVVVAESGREMGTYPTIAQARERLHQVEMFKHMRGR